MSYKRKIAFTSFEKELIKELVAEVAHIIESKKTDADYNRKKILNPLCQEATHQKIRKLWLNLKAKARDAKSNERQRFHTGGGAYVRDMSQEDDAVLSIVPHIMPTINVMRDSDGRPDIDGEDDDLGWMPVEKRPRMSSINTPYYVTTHPSTPHTVNTHTATACITTKNTAPYPGIPLIKIKRTAIQHPMTTHTATTLPEVVHTPITHTATTHPATTTTSSSTAKPKTSAKTTFKTKPSSNIDILKKSELIQNNINYFWGGLCPAVDVYRLI